MIVNEYMQKLFSFLQDRTLFCLQIEIDFESYLNSIR